jgi:exopolysaccharide production protein ExoZ
MKRLYGIQYLRAAAALGVVVFHAAERSGTHFAIGAAGVDVFFVISGFIMWVVASERAPSPAVFLRDRIERIAPLYWIATGVMVVGALAGLFPNLRLTAWYVLSSLFFIASRSPSTGDIWPVLVQGWTLNYEMFFYVLFAATLFLPARRRFSAMAALFLALVAAGWMFQPETPVLKTWTDPLLLEFLIGMAIGKAWLKGAIPAPGTGVALMAVSIAGFAFVGVTYAGFTPFVLGPLAAALVLGVLTFEKHATMPRLPLASYLGDSSYSIYLWHTMAISVVAKAGSAFSAPGPVVCGVAIVSGIAIGAVAHEALEKPIAAFLKNRRRARRLRTISPPSR